MDLLLRATMENWVQIAVVRMGGSVCTMCPIKAVTLNFKS